ncbi:stannin isoform X2 [Artibeus jamaicensis]|uniref:stannin isoform X2 n=1 Tax=Artibeus jamaicensis TaxID=9417 RepID=UPI00235ADB9C|nr:stannin isoform X2 [Artibeus jamaicensis]
MVLICELGSDEDRWHTWQTALLEERALVSILSSSLTKPVTPKSFLLRKLPPASTMSIMDHSPTTGVVTVIVILIAIAALGALILGCWCYLRLQRISQSEDEESIVGDGETKEPFLLVQYSAKGPCVERKAKLTPNGPEVHS